MRKYDREELERIRLKQRICQNSNRGKGTPNLKLEYIDDTFIDLQNVKVLFEVHILWVGVYILCLYFCVCSCNYIYLCD